MERQDAERVCVEGNAISRSINEAGSHLIIVYDNNTLEKGLTSSWGLSCFITRPEYRLLFDTGGDPSILVKNMNRMDIDPEKIDSVVLSHGHGDHTGGLAGLLRYHNDLTIYMPKSFPRRFKKECGSTGARVEEAGVPVMIYPGVYTTGELGKGIKEQSLVLKTCQGLVIITGCAHPGILQIVDHARKIFKENIYLLIGGFHLMGRSPNEIIEIANRLDELKVERIAPCHCSGDTARRLFSHHFADNYFECGAGLALEIPDLQE